MLKMLRVSIVAGLVLVALGSAPVRSAEDQINWVRGPANVAIGDKATLELPQGYLYAGKDELPKLDRMTGNLTKPNELAAIAFPRPEHQGVWIAYFSFSDAGFVKDADKDSINADAILKSIKEGTESENGERTHEGYPALHVSGWYQEPAYNATSKNLEWGIKATADEKDGPAEVINYNVRLLGRHGVMSATLADDQDHLAASIPQFRALLSAYKYNDGQRYADFVPGDKVAEYGLAALITGGAAAAAAKTGLLGKFWKVLAGFAAAGGKAIWVAIAGAFAFVGNLVKRIFRRNNQ